MNRVLRERYEILNQIGSGGFGTTFLAKDHLLPDSGYCVVKQLKQQSCPATYALHCERFEREAQFLTKLSEDSQGRIPKMLDYFEEEAFFYLVQEWVDGKTLNEILKVEGPLGEKEVLDILQKVLRILQFIHSRKIIHRDIKPSNIILRREDRSPVLIDFGSVKEVIGTDPASGMTSVVIGTDDYMPSEQAIGKPVFASDLYSLAVTAIYLLTGVPPKKLHDQATGRLVWRSQVQGNIPPFSDVLDKATAPNFPDRYPTAAEMLQALNTPRVPPLQSKILIDLDDEKSTIIRPEKKSKPAFSPEQAQDEKKPPSFGSRLVQGIKGLFTKQPKEETPVALVQNHPSLEKVSTPKSQVENKVDQPVQSHATALPTEVPAGKLVESPVAEKKKSWFGSSSKPAPVSKDEEIAQNEQKVLDALYAEYKSASGALRGEEGVGQVSSLPRLPEPPASGELSLVSGETIDLLESLKEFPEIPSNEPVLFKAPGPSGSGSIPGETPISDTRKFAREAIRLAQERAKGMANQELPVGQPDHQIEKMVQCSSIIRHKSTDTSEWRTGQQQQRVMAGVPRAAMQPVEGAPALPRSPEPVAKSTTLPYFLPPIEMLQEVPEREEQADTELRQRAKVLAEKCREFNVTGEIHHINPGPVVTTFEFKPDPGVKFNRIVNLVDDLCLAIKTETIQVKRIPGKLTVAIEVKNPHRETVFLREIIESERYQESGSNLTLPLGKTSDGMVYLADLLTLPHLLIAGAIRTGKSSFINSFLVTILLKATPVEVKMILVDTKRIDLTLFDGIPHLLSPIVTDPQRASNALKWAVTEMENRYKQLAGFGVRNIDQFNREICGSNDVSRFGIQVPPPKLPYLVVVIDDLADLMSRASLYVEPSLTQLVLKGHRVGMHLIVATSRLTVSVLSTQLKSLFTARIALRMSSKLDSKSILNAEGAEELFDQGDMLFGPNGAAPLIRIHGSFVSEPEILRIVEFTKAQGQPQYDETIQMSDAEAESAEAGMRERDELFDEAMKIVVQMGKASASDLQRRLRIGYGRAAAILEMMAQEGYIGSPDGSKPQVVKQLAYDYVDYIRR